MPKLDICLFGRFRVSCRHQDVADFNALKVQQLFCYLLLYRDRAHRREFLSELLWGESASALNKKYLRKTLWQLQSAVDSLPGIQRDELLRIESDWIQVNPQADVCLDVQSFEKGYASLVGVPGGQLSSGDFQRAQGTLELYKGDLLEGWETDWCLYERERYKKMFLGLMDRLMEHCELAGDFNTGIEYGNQALRCDPADELAHWRLMRLYSLAGHRTAAIRQYEACRAALKTDLDVEPGERIRGLYEQIASSQGKLLELGGGEPGPGLGDALKRINTLVEMQSAIQRQLMEELATMEKTLRNFL
jgi:DNA-binding SARP family transcriptional activator